LMVLFHIEEGWHINSSRPQEGRVPTTVEVTTDLPLRLGAPMWSRPKRVRRGGETVEIYTRTAHAIVPVLEIGGEGAEDGFARIFVRYQPCTDTECGLPVERVYLMPLSLRPE